MSTGDTVTIDGSYGEGGGQILRTALSLAAITGRTVEFVDIRANRTPPGLKAQHLAAVNAAAQICAANVDGAAVGSKRLRFAPQAAVAPGSYRFEIGTAGAATLVAQTVLLPLALAGDGAEGSTVTVIGGTNVPHSPPFDFLEGVYGAVLREYGLDARFVSPAAGFFPRGGGRINAQIGQSRLTPFDFAEPREKSERLTAHIVTAGLPDHVAERGGAAVKSILRERNVKGVQVEHHDVAALSPGAAIVLVAGCAGGLRAGFSAIGERGKPMERVAEEACADFWQWRRSNACCDEHLADQLVLPAGLTPGESRWTTVRITEHLRTVLWVVQQFLPVETSLEKREDGSGLVTVHGAAGA